jgi:hypothetical protein
MNEPRASAAFFFSEGRPAGTPGNTENSDLWLTALKPFLAAKQKPLNRILIQRLKIRRFGITS